VGKRINILQKLINHPYVYEDTVDQIQDFLCSWNPKVGIACGSYNPMHVGHLDIIRQAEKVFDKVIIAQGYNREKLHSEYSIHDLKTIRYYQKDVYTGSLVEYLKEKQNTYANLTVIRGLRNNDDLEHETILMNFTADYIDVPFMYVLSKAEHRHISSAAIRQLQKVGNDVSKYLIT